MSGRGIVASVSQRNDLNESLFVRVDELPLGGEARRRAMGLRVTYVYELVQLTRAEVLRCRGVGPKTLRSIEACLRSLELPLCLGMSFDEELRLMLSAECSGRRSVTTSRP